MSKTICKIHDFRVEHKNDTEFKILGHTGNTIKGEVVKEENHIVLYLDKKFSTSRCGHPRDGINIFVSTYKNGEFVLLDCYFDDFLWKYNPHMRNQLYVSSVLHQPPMFVPNEIGTFDLFSEGKNELKFDRVRFRLGENVGLKTYLMISGWQGKEWSEIVHKEYYTQNRRYVNKEKFPEWHQPEDVVLCVGEKDDFVLKLICRKQGWDFGATPPEEVYWELQFKECLGTQQILKKLRSIAYFFEFLMPMRLSLSHIHITARAHEQRWDFGEIPCRDIPKNVHVVRNIPVWWNVENVDLIGKHNEGCNEGHKRVVNDFPHSEIVVQDERTSPQAMYLYRYLRELNFNRQEGLQKYLPSFLDKIEKDEEFGEQIKRAIKGQTEGNWDSSVFGRTVEYLYCHLLWERKGDQSWSDYTKSKEYNHKMGLEKLASLPDHDFGADFAKEMKNLRHKGFAHYDEEKVTVTYDTFSDFCKLVRFGLFHLIHGDRDLNTELARFR